MTKEERLKYMQNKFPQLVDSKVDAILPISQVELEEEVNLLKGVEEFNHIKELDNQILTSDER